MIFVIPAVSTHPGFRFAAGEAEIVRLDSRVRGNDGRQPVLAAEGP
ncbi:MAG: hypothetical protein Q8J99_17660 [Sulfuritalea sp.]|nr:hypothetical protein [Sulfuritalea sp.]